MIEETYHFDCPYCYSKITLNVDLTEGSKQQFTYDCEVCCRPMAISIHLGDDGVEDFIAVMESQ